ncbi:bifunctional riboflavin kinase/FAD synthetase [Hoeflea sp. YIM 152468]|uniref:bifunctional riboflavin kinase/FAD synthetase n=1 Tax=Hoeflea sp. YIM 152468 TaxID=3031759 RepID=UPI0023DA8A02|nr:bifunctional riboflavin kinase/FAD synthetase [Hoeflea sp. YIM 152468]MDF1606784.1 bifunctional riboflavin kinase/FAD synthetase [Hoeflea sp. YIM 152468]
MARRFHDVCGFVSELKGNVVAIGNFDGVHRGHQAVLAHATQAAKSAGVSAVVLTFEPHPRTVFRPDQPVFRLTPAPMKAAILGHLGFDAVVEQPFDKAFSAQSAEDFVKGILCERLGVRHVFTGYDFHFGKGREGNPDFLMKAGERHGFGVTLIDQFQDENAEVVSSSRIREALARGDVVEAAGLLGYRYAVSAAVLHGKKLGRKLGYPTANMALPPETELLPGIYAVRYRRADGTLYDGVASFGRRPTIAGDGAALLLETFLFDFSGDLYDEVCTVSLVARLRGEEKFDDLDALVRQMKIDEAEARAVLGSLQPLTPLDAAMTFGPAA